MRIGVFVDDGNFDGVDLSHPNLGNPGVGGTPLCFALLLHYYRLSYADEIYLYHRNQSTVWPKTAMNVVVRDVYESVKVAKEDGCDVLLFRFGVEPESLYELMDQTRLPCIGWCHNFIEYEQMQIISRHQYFYRLIFVGLSQFERIVDCPGTDKCMVIENLFSEDATVGSNIPKGYVKSDFDIVFSGSLTKMKGFSELAKAWPRVVSEVPNARLVIIGNGQLYSKGIKLGPYGLAERDYERTFIHHLLDKNGKMLPSVISLGNLGTEKHYVYANSLIGIVNPTGTETLSLSAIEMQNFGLPVISRKKNGTMYSIQDGKTGLLFSRKGQMVHQIIRLLRDDTLRNRLASEARRFVKLRFAHREIINQWHKCFCSSTSSGPTETEAVKLPKVPSSILARLARLNARLNNALFFGRPVTYWNSRLRRLLHRLW